MRFSNMYVFPIQFHQLRLYVYAHGPVTYFFGAAVREYHMTSHTILCLCVCWNWYVYKNTHTCTHTHVDTHM